MVAAASSSNGKIRTVIATKATRTAEATAKAPPREASTEAQARPGQQQQPAAAAAAAEVVVLFTASVEAVQLNEQDLRMHESRRRTEPLGH